MSTSAGGDRRDPLRRQGDIDALCAAAEAAVQSRIWTRRRLLIAGLVVGAAVFGGLIVGSVLRGSELEEAAYHDCREDNLAIAYQRVVAMRAPSLARRRPRPAHVLPILWCRATVDRGRPVRLRAREERRWLARYVQERLPVVDDATGRVVGSEPLPAAR